jgi:hypothetical protein
MNRLALATAVIFTASIGAVAAAPMHPGLVASEGTVIHVQTTKKMVSKTKKTTQKKKAIKGTEGMGTMKVDEEYVSVEDRGVGSASDLETVICSLHSRISGSLLQLEPTGS